MNDECEYCQAPEVYGLRPAVTVDVRVWTTNKGANGGGKKTVVHPPQHPVTGFYGVRCKKQTDRPF
jgi:hypothetical protein